MPADRSLADGAGDELISLYHQLRYALIIALASRLRRSLTGQDNPRSIAARLLARKNRVLAGLVERAVTAAHERGQAAADAEIRRLPPRSPRPSTGAPLPGELISRREELAATLRSTDAQVLRWASRAYHETALAASQAEGGTRLQQAQRTWSQLVRRGVTGFVDRTGREWDLASYVEMATRTRLAETAVQGHLSRLERVGIDLVIVSNAPFECRRCRPWEGKILARTGGDAREVRVEHATQDRIITVRVAGSVADAIRDGLMHPNCRHSLSAYLPGVTTVPTHTEDPQGDEARATLRSLERAVRSLKLDAAAALDPVKARQARAQVRATEVQIRQHLKAHPGLLRQPQRELIGVAR